jgi:hypothetical protein
VRPLELVPLRLREYTPEGVEEAPVLTVRVLDP